MINIDIALNQENENKRKKNDNPLDTTGGDNPIVDLDKEIEATLARGTGKLDFYIQHPEYIEPQDEEAYEPGHLSGIPRGIANFIGAGVDYGGQVFFNNTALWGTEIAGAINAIPELTVVGKNGLFELSPGRDEERPLKDTPHGWLPPEVQQKIADEHWRAGMSEVPAWFGSKWKGGMEAVDHLINGTEKTFIDQVTHGGGTATGFGGASATIRGGINKLIDDLPPFDPKIKVLKFIANTLEAGTEAGGFIIDKYSQDPSILRNPDKLVGIAKLAGMDFAANAVPDFLLDTAGDYVGSLLPVTGLGKKFIKGALGEVVKENIQEAYQSATERATEKVFQSGDFSLDNFGRNLWDEYKNIVLPYTDEQGNQHSGYLWEQMPEVSASTLLSTIVMGAVGLPNPRQKGHIFTKAGRQTMVDNSNLEDWEIIMKNPQKRQELTDTQNKSIYNSLKTQREELQESINRAYEGLGQDADTDIASLAEIAQMEQKLYEYNDAITNFWGDTGITANPVQDDAMSLFPDADTINKINSSPNTYMDNAQEATVTPQPDTQQTQNIPPIVETDTATPVNDIIQSEEHPTNNIPDLLPDAQKHIHTENLLRDLDIAAQNNFNDDYIDDEPDEYLDEDFDVEQYNQTIPTDNSQSSSDDYSRNIGTFVFNSGGSNSKDYSLDVVSSYVNAGAGVSQNYSNRLNRWNGRVIELRNKRGKVIATFKPYLGGNGLIFSHDFESKHSLQWMQKFERDFMRNAKNYLANGGFIGEDGNLRPDGNEAFRERWSARMKAEGTYFGSFASNEPMQEDFDAPNVGTLSVSYQNNEGREVAEDLSVEIGTFGDDMPEQQQFFGRHLNIRDKNGRLIARYSPRTSSIRFTANSNAQAMKNAVIEKLKRQANSIIRKTGFLDENGKIIPDGNEGYRERRKNANSIPNSIPSLTELDINGLPPSGQNAQDITHMQDTPQPSLRRPSRKTSIADAISSLGNRVNTGLGNETYNQSWMGSVTDWVSGLLGRNNNSTSTTQSTQGNQSNTKTIKVISSDGNEHTLTATRKDFDDKYGQAKLYHGSYIEFTDENGRVVARWSPYSRTFQMADIPDADTLQPQIVRSLNNFRNNYLRDFGYVDEYGRLLDDGNEDFRHKYRTRFDTTPEGKTAHPDNLNTEQTKTRKDTRSWWQRFKDSRDEKQKHDKVRKNVRKTIYSELRKFAQYNNYNGLLQHVEGETTRARNRRIHRYVANLAEQYSHVITARIAASAHLAGMSVEDYQKLWNLRVQQDIIPNTKTSGFVDFQPINDTHKQAETIIHLTQLHNESTILHEFAHIFLRDYQDLIASVEDLPSKVKKDWLYLTRWLGISDIDPKSTNNTRNDDEKSRMRNAQEKFAVAFEQYYMTGKAPKSKLQRVFNYFKEWLSHVYGAIKNIKYQGSDKQEHEVELSPEVKRIFARMLKGSNYYIPSAESSRARIERTNNPQHGEEFHNQTASGQGNGFSLGRQNSIRDLLDVMHSELGRKNSGQVWADYARVSQDEAKRISEATGLNINEKYVHTIIGSAVTHTLNRHGEGNEKLEAQLPITDADFERIPEIIQNADEIRRGNEKVTGGINDTIVYKKRINGHVLVVEEVRTGRKKLAFHTMRKTKAGYDYDLSNEAHPVVKESAKSQVITSDNDPTPEARFTHALSTESVQSRNDSVNPPRISRSNNSFISPEDIERFDQLAMHGSGHILKGNSFDLQYIGSGEGEQMFGWGIYFAQHPEVAENYRHYGKDVSLLDHEGNKITLDAETAYTLSDILSQYSKKELLDDFTSIKDLYIRVFENEIKYYSAKHNEKEATLAANIVHALKQAASATALNGNIYFADIPENDVLLDLMNTQQTPKVQQAMRKIIQKLSRHISNEALERLNLAHSGAEFYDALKKAVQPLIDKGKIKSKKHGTISRADMAASLLLNQAGIPGLRYWDAGSRDKKHGTYNFVIWNTDMIKLLGLSADSDEEAKKYFRDTARAKQQGKSEIYKQSIGLARTEYDFSSTADAKKQYDAVVKQFKGTAQWLKAPNGNPTNLTEKQWVMVRTSNFIRWFGNWQNNPAQASKVLDENGEPLVVYHGTPNGSFNTFRIIGEGGSEKTGAWFTENKNIAQVYTKNTRVGKVFATFLNIRNPYVLDAHNRGWNELAVRGRMAITTDHVVRGVWAGILGDGNNDGVIIRNVIDPYVPIDDYILRIPNNIKSATHNNGNFGHADNIYHQIIGTSGARRLDEAEGVTTHMDNLRIARRMEHKNIPVNKIWAATGWMRGHDGKWRYEIPDGKIIRKKLDELRNITNELASLDKS